MRQAKWIVPVLLLGGLVAAALAGDLDATPDWLDALSTSHGVQREAAIQALALRPDLLSDLLTELESDHPPITQGAIGEVLARMKLSPSDVASMTSLLDSSQPTVRAAGLRILGAHAASARLALAKVAADTDEATALRAMAAAGLGGSGAAALADLRGLLQSDETPDAVRLAAVRALPQVSDDGMGDAAALASDPDARRTEREAAVQALGAAGEAGRAPLQTLALRKETWIRAASLSALAAENATANVQAFVGGLTDTAPAVRLVALQGLATAGALTANRTAIASLLTDADVRVQQRAALFVGATFGDSPSTVVPTLKGLLLSTSFAVRREAALALLALKDKSGLATMQADRASTNPSQAASAQAAYTQILNASW